MKKKLIALVLALSACFSLTACDAVKDKLSGLPVIGGWFGGDSTEDPAEEYDLEGAKKLLESRVKTTNAESREEYAIPSSFQLLGITYTVEWSVDVDTVKLEKDGDNVYVNVYEASLSFEDTPFVLTAKISAPDGTSIETKMNRIVPKLERYVPAAITEKPQENVAYKLNAYSIGKNKDLYFAGEVKSSELWYYLKTIDTYEHGADVYAEHVEGSEDEFYLYHEVKATDGSTTKEYINIVQTGTHINAQLSTEPVALKFSTEYGTFYRNLGGVDCILTTEGSYGTFGGAKASDVGEEITPVCLVGEIDRTQVSNEDKLEYELTSTTLAPAFVGGGNDATVVKHGNRYPDVKIEWKSNNEAISFNRTTVSFAEVSETTEVTVTATLTIGEGNNAKTEMKTIPVKVVPNTQEAILATAATLEDNKGFGNDVTLTGVVVSIDEAYDPTYDSVTFTMKVGDKSVKGYRMKGDGADVLAAGFTVTCSGEFINYGGTLEFNFASIESYEVGEAPEAPEAPETAEEILNALYALSSGETMTGEFTLTGKITELDSYSNPTIVVEGYETMPVYCFKLSVDNAVGDTITVTATTMKNYGGTYEFMNCTLVSDVEDGNEGDEVTPPADDDNAVTEPVENVAYKFYMTQSNGINYYFTGETASSYKFLTTVYPTDAIDVYAEKADAGYYFTVTVDDTKMYMGLVDDPSSDYVNLQLVDQASATVFAYNADVTAWTATVGGVAKYLGSYNAYTHIQNSNLSYLTENPANIGKTQFPAQLMTAEEAATLDNDTERVSFEKENVTLAEAVEGARTIPLMTAGKVFTNVTVEWTVTEGTEIASVADGSLVITNPTAETTVKVVATITSGEAFETKEFNVKVTPMVDDGTPKAVATFDFGANGTAEHVDGPAISSGKEFSANGYTLTLNDVSKVYDASYDAKGNSCLKLGTGSATGTFTFTVEDGVNKVVIYVSGYKAKTSKISINGGTETTLSVSSNDGEYTAIEIDTSTTKTITVATVGNSTGRIMINTIEFWS